jgi:Mn2+/Fe2+ NRAMP family transporter
VKRIANVVLGVVTSIGGFAEAGSLSTSLQAGAEFGFALLWTIPIAALMLAMLLEMSGRLSALSGRTYAAAVRDRFGAHVQCTMLVVELLLDLLLLTAELGGVAVALQLVTGVALQWWLVPVAIAGGLLLWLGTFAVIEDGLGLLGLVTLVFVVAAWRLHPAMPPVVSGLLPSKPPHDPASYAFIAVSIVGATVSPYLLNFYGSGAVEEEWTARDLWSNRITSFVGIGFGALVSVAALVCAALVLAPQHVKVDSLQQAAAVLNPIFHSWGVPLFALALGIGCFGAAVEIALNAGYVAAQGFGWTWGANKRRLETARFSIAMTLILIAALIVAAFGFNPMQVTLISVGIAVIFMPVVVLPLLVLMNDDRFVTNHRNGPIGNAALAIMVVLGALLAVVVVPLQIIGGG